MSTAGTADLPLSVFSGRVTDIAPSDLPSGASPENRDTAFPLGGWRTRPGLGAGVFAAIGGNPTVNYMKTFIDQQINKRLLYLDGAGTLWQDFPYGTETSTINAFPIPAGSYGKSATAYGREYMAFSDGQFGLADPAQWDGVNYDRTSQVGPGLAPSVSDENAPFPMVASPNGVGFAMTNAQSALAPLASPNGLSMIANTVTVTIDPSGSTIDMRAGDTVNIVGATNAAYDGSYQVTKVVGPQQFEITSGLSGLAASGGGAVDTSQAEVVLSAPGTFVAGEQMRLSGLLNFPDWNANWEIRRVISTTDFIIYVPGHYITDAGFANDGGGTASIGGHINAGLHGISVFFITRTGYWTRFAPPVYWQASGGLRAVVTGIPVGPPNVVSRVLVFTTAGGATFFFTTNASNTLYSGNMVIADNSTTTLTVDFSDTILAAGNNVQYLANLLELESSAGVVSYATRLFWWGGRNRVPNFLNMSFNGGVPGAIGLNSLPCGWSAGTNFAPGAGAGGGLTLGLLPHAWSYYITNNGDNVSGIKGMITQPAAVDYLGNVILKPSTQYSVRLKLAKGGPTNGTGVIVDLFSPTAGVLATLTFLQSLIFGPLREFILPFNAPTPASIPADTVLRVYAIYGTSLSVTTIFLNNLEIFPTLTPFLTTTIRASYAGEPESYDQLTGVLQPFFQDGGVIRAAFVLRELLYICKDDKWYVTSDDGANEPSSWKITQVSGAVGAAGPNAADVGEDWGIVANRNGPYVFWGAEPVKIGQEIQSDASGSGKITWSSINWQYGYTIWVLVDKTNKRALIGAPVNGATSPNVIFYFDYRGMDTAEEVADHWSVKYSSYTGKILAIGNAPKWGLWNISSTSAALIERGDGTTHTFIGNGAAAPLVGSGPSSTGKIYDLLDANKDDDGAGIPYSYTTYYAPDHTDEQTLAIKSHRKLFSYLTGFVRGSGPMSISIAPTGNISPIEQLAIRLVDPVATAAISAISRVSSITTVTCPGGHGLTIGIDTQVVIAGAGDPSFIGTFPIATILNNQQFTFYQANVDLILGAGGTVARLQREFELTTNVLAERAAYTFANQGNVAGSWCQMEKLIFSLAPDAHSPVRGGTY